MPKVSIITASYNYQDYIKESIESVINQTYSDWELIIVDDGSDDDSVNVIKSYCEKDDRIKLFTHENGVNKGLAETIKLGIKNANSDWIAFLESDDILKNNYLSRKFEVIEKYPDVKFVFNDVETFGDKDKIDGLRIYFRNREELLKNVEFPSNLLNAFSPKKSNVIPTFSCVMVKKDLFKSIDYDTPIKPMLDLYIWLQLANNTFYYIDEKLTDWRIHKDSYINDVKPDLYKEFLFDCKKIDFLYGQNAWLKKLKLLLNYLRKSFIRINTRNREIVIFNKSCKY